jgi:antitoxin FitA
MTTLTIPDLDDELQATLRKRAARHGHSVEEAARGLLRQVLTQSPPPAPLGQRLVQRFRGVAMDLPRPTRRLPRAPRSGMIRCDPARHQRAVRLYAAGNRAKSPCSF